MATLENNQVDIQMVSDFMEMLRKMQPRDWYKMQGYGERLIAEDSMDPKKETH